MEEESESQNYIESSEDAEKSSSPAVTLTNENEQMFLEEKSGETLIEESPEQIADSEEVASIHAGDSALNFLQNIDQNLLELCIFDDQLVTYSEEEKSIGEFKANVEKVVIDKENLLLVHATSHGKVEDTPMRTSITCYLHPQDLSLVRQEHNEYVKVPGHELEKRTEMKISKETGNLVVERRVTHGDKMKISKFKIPKEKLSGFITEGASIIIERLMVKSGAGDEKLSFITLDSDSSHLVATEYNTLQMRKQQIGLKELDVIGIERKVQSAEGVPQRWQSYFMDDGHLTMRAQTGSSVVAKVEKVPLKIEPEIFEPKPVFGKQPLDWENDMEMKSRFVQRKEELKAGHQTYLRQHPEASALLSDFFQFLLLRKPDDVTVFAANFFSSFSATAPDTSAYNHSNKSSLYNFNSG